MDKMNDWVLFCEGRLVQVQYAWAQQNDFYAVAALEPTNTAPNPGDPSALFSVYDLGDGTVAFECHGGGFAWGGINPQPGTLPEYFITFTYPEHQDFYPFAGSWHLRPIPSGDGYFLLSPQPGYHVTIAPCGVDDSTVLDALYVALDGDDGYGDFFVPARFTAMSSTGNSLFDLIKISNSASGLCLAGFDLTNVNFDGVDLSLCDFRHVANGSLSGCSVRGANLQEANFNGMHLAGLQMATADCTGADFSDCNFGSIESFGGQAPPTLTGADLTGAVIPGGTSWPGVNMSAAALAEATLTGPDLAGAKLIGADFTGASTRSFSAAYQSETQGPGGVGIGGYDLRNARDRIIAFDYDGTPGTARPNDLVCYRPGDGACAVLDEAPGGTFGSIYFQGDGGAGIGGYDLRWASDQIIAFDYTSTGHLDHLVCYRPGGGNIWVIEKTGTDASGKATFGMAWSSASGIGGSGGCDLRHAGDRIIAFDYTATGHLDHLLCYRPGSGLLWIFATEIGPNSAASFTPVFSSTDGIGGYPLTSAADQIIAFDGESTGRLDHLVCYQPGGGAVSVLEKQSGQNNAVTFAPIFASATGLGGCDLSNAADRIIAFDYASTGNADHLACSRPAGGAAVATSSGIVTCEGTVWIAQRTTDAQKRVTFPSVYRKRIGIGGYDLSDPGDQVIAYDYAGTGNLDHLVCYRPGAGKCWILGSQPTGPATLASDAGVPCKLTGADLSSAQLAHTTLAGVDLSDATLVGTDFTGADLTQVTFSPPLIRSTDPNNPTIFVRCKLAFSAIGLDWSCFDLTSAKILNLPSDLSGLIANGARLSSFPFNGLTLDGAKFAGATLDHADFSGAKLRQAANGQTPSFAGALLVSSVFTNSVLDQASFTSATLTGEPGSQAANFSSAWISNCDFTEANAYGAIFAEATLVSGNVLSGAQSLDEADFSGAYLAGATFSGASLQGAKFDGACLVQCDLTGVDLTPAQQGAVAASLTSACLQGATFTQKTKLGGANLNNAAIAATANERGTIEVSHYDENHHLVGPEGIVWVGSPPNPSTFSDATVCPNGNTYGENTEQGLTLATMMTSTSAPTKWTPTDTRRA